MIRKKLIGEALLAVREQLGLTQKELSDISGVPQPRISKYERGEQMPRADYLLALTNALKITPDEIYRIAGAWENQIKDIKAEFDIEIDTRKFIRVISRLDKADKELLITIAERMTK